jgi:hypothetical protein
MIKISAGPIIMEVIQSGGPSYSLSLPLDPHGLTSSVDFFFLFPFCYSSSDLAVAAVCFLFLVDWNTSNWLGLAAPPAFALAWIAAEANASPRAGIRSDFASSRAASGRVGPGKFAKKPLI